MTIISICEGKKELKVGNKFLEFEDVKCRKTVHATVMNIRKHCGEKGTTLVIGYSFEELNDYLPLINVCYNQAKGIAFYSEHILHGEEIKCKFLQLVIIFQCEFCRDISDNSLSLLSFVISQNCVNFCTFSIEIFLN